MIDIHSEDFFAVLRRSIFGRMADHGLCEAGKAGRVIHNGCVTKMCLFSEQKDD